MDTIKLVKQEVEDFYHLPAGSIDTHTRKREIKTARQLAHFLAKEQNSFSLSHIGINIGGVDHTTVINSCRNIGDAISKDHRGRVIDPEILGVVQRLRLRIHYRMERDNIEWANAVAQM